MAQTFLPRQDVPLVESGGRASNPFYVFLQSLETAQQAGASTAELQAQIDALSAAIAESAESAGLVLGQASIRQFGTLADGKVFLQLEGDEVSPGATYYYGTDAAGTKGWHELSTTGVPEGANLYYTDARADARVALHADRTDNPHAVTAAQVGADPTGTAATAVNNYVASLAGLPDAVDDAAAAAAAVPVGGQYRTGSILKVRIS